MNAIRNNHNNQNVYIPESDDINVNNINRFNQ